MPVSDWFNSNLRRVYPIVSGPTLNDAKGLFTADDPDFTWLDAGSLRRPFRDNWIVDAGFFLQHPAGFDPTIHSVRLVYMKYEIATGNLHIEFRSDSPNMIGHRFVVTHNDEFWSPLGSAARFITYLVPAITGNNYQPPLRAAAYTAPTSAQVGDGAYGGTYDETGTDATTRGWCFVTVGTTQDWINELVADLEMFPQVIYQIEPPQVQSFKDLQALSINLANTDGLDLPDPCNPDQSLIRPVVANSAISDGVAILGNVKMVEGFNASIEVSEPTKTVEIGARVRGGSGGVCDDPLVGPIYATYGDPNFTCKNLIFAINGVRPNADGKFRFRGGPGVKFTTNKTTNTLTISAKPENRIICDEDIDE